MAPKWALLRPLSAHMQNLGAMALE
ncbi:uncharacterized protein G2W53_005677 [Senna tora]|uniref:Uncharacterized protein n=1 Tax=Senna tora TaxID=362788 RepID=A0A835CE11_9FABA|nr:uncharacterized protein G2W53_005677 [Senna tora]